MALALTIDPIVIRYSREQLESWKTGDRGDCPEGYCKGLPHSYGFGEYLVGRYWQERGYLWMHHDFDVFGGNRDDKYVEAQAVLRQALGDERFEAARNLSESLEPFARPGHGTFEEPDLLIYTPDCSHVRFAECKRPANNDRLRPQQGIGLFLLGALLACPVDVFIVAEEGASVDAAPVVIEFGGASGAS